MRAQWNDGPRFAGRVAVITGADTVKFSELDTAAASALLQPEEIAETVLFLASDGAGYITGQVIRLDGGWVAAGRAGAAP